MTPHKHAEVLRQIADGVPLSEFEVRCAEHPQSTWMTLVFADFHIRPDFWEVRRKHQHIVVNGFKVPKPLEEDPGILVWVPNLISDTLVASRQNPRNRLLAVERRIAHSTLEAAIAHAKAMLGIDPKWEEG